MYLYLVQHAEARSEAEDPQQALSDKGLAEIEKTARLLATKVRPSIKIILHSGKLRARQTAEILADHLAPVGGVKQVEGLKPNDDVSDWAGRLTAASENIMLVGHLPYLSKLTSKLLCGDETMTLVEFRKAGIVCLFRDEQKSWRIEWFIVPGLCE